MRIQASWALALYWLSLAESFFFGDKLTWFGRLPGDIRLGERNSSFYFPVVTCIVVSAVLNLIIVLIRRFFGS